MKNVLFVNISEKDRKILELKYTKYYNMQFSEVITQTDLLDKEILVFPISGESYDLSERETFNITESWEKVLFVFEKENQILLRYLCSKGFNCYVKENGWENFSIIIEHILSRLNSENQTSDRFLRLERICEMFFQLPISIRLELQNNGSYLLKDRDSKEKSYTEKLECTPQPIKTDELKFTELFNLEDIQHLQDLFANATGVASIITDPQGVPITKPSNFTRFCLGIVRKSCKGEANCFKSDAEIGRFNTGGPVIQPCLSGGLWDAGASLHVGGKHIGNWLIGQVRDETQNVDQIRKYAKEIEVDPEELAAEFLYVPVMSHERFTAVANTLYAFASQLSTLAYQNLLQIQHISEMNIVEEQLRTSQHYTRLLFDESNIPLVVMEPRTGKYMDCNMAAVKLYGYKSKSEIIGKSPLDFSCPFQSNGVRSEVLAKEMVGICLKNGSHIFEWKHQRADGTIWDSEVNLMKFNHEGNTLIQFSLTDITEKKKATAEIKKNNERIRILLEIFQYPQKEYRGLIDFALSEAIKLTESQLGYIYLYDADLKDFILKSWTQNDNKAAIPVPEKDSSLWKEVFFGGKSILCNQCGMAEEVNQNPGIKRFLSIPMLNEKRIIAVIGVANKYDDYDSSDENQLTLLMNAVWKVVENYKSTEALRDSESKFRTFFANITEGVALHEVIYDESGQPINYRVTEVNSAYEAHTGLKPEKIVGKLAHVIYGTEEAPYLKEFTTVADTGEPYRFETYFPPLKKHFLISVISPKKGQFATVFEDVTEGIVREEELRKKNEELARFTYTVSHDLKSPLVTIKAFSAYLRQDLEKKDEQRVIKDLSFIQNAADKMGNLLDELLELSRIGRKDNPKSFFPLKQIIDSVCDLLAGNIQQSKARIFMTEKPVYLYGDFQRLIQLYQNLIDNAIKFSRKNEEIRIEIGCEYINKEIVLSVKDNGKGIDLRYQHKLFGLFEKLDNTTEGTGIGLALVKRIVEVNKGRIWFVSEGVDAGTVFYFTLEQTKIGE